MIFIHVSKSILWKSTPSFKGVHTVKVILLNDLEIVQNLSYFSFIFHHYLGFNCRFLNTRFSKCTAVSSRLYMDHHFHMEPQIVLIFCKFLDELWICVCREIQMNYGFVCVEKYTKSQQCFY